MLRDFFIGALIGLWFYLTLSLIAMVCISRIRTRVNRHRSVAAEIGWRCRVEPAARSAGFLSRGCGARRRRYILGRILS